MDLVVPCNSCTYLYRRPSHHWRLSSPKRSGFPFSSFKCRRKTTSELQTPVSVTSPNGCCTSCAVRVKSGQIRQPEALGISAELKEKGYALLCVGFPLSDLEVETQDEDEVYWLQFGRYFARGPVERDDYALELAMGDE
ncbi:hypothetical protein DITRI_Ditri04bG0092700 [Diplodiscus trichospermus]